MILQAKDALGRVPRLNGDLLDVKTNYLDHGGAFYLAVDENDRVVGSVGVSPIDGTDEAFLHRLFVKAALKRRGIGGALLGAAEDFLRAQGKRAARVHLGEPKEQWFESYQFYEKHGFEEYAPRFMRKVL
ncbi:MAG: GNAT family N-acetyltransferase [Clostridia bacterium]|nr:GNAT family N-acetyltransferase [Clostridia bacterium]MBO4883807.1 GNAT family N-acetyltransferase [Clostridia bacterium]MBR4442440.1 GNAT family N-acetyltransferase [Clostridia bacterium]